MDRIIEIKTDEETAIKEFLEKRYSAPLISRLYRTDGISINGIIGKSNSLIKPGDLLTLVFKETLVSDYKPLKMNIEIVFEDEDTLVVLKDSGIAVMPTRAHYDDNLFCGLEYLYPGKVFRVVTRLDKDTKGLVLLTKNALAHSILSENIKSITRIYYAELCGIVEKDTVINAPIARLEGIKRGVSPVGDPACTKLKVLGYYNGNTVGEFTLLTGRTHQIRVHSAYIGHPVAGDTLYGNCDGVYNGGQKLFCGKLSYISPINRKYVEIDKKMVFLKNYPQFNSV